MTITIIILAVITAGSITALFLRGFKFKDLGERFTNQSLQTPSMEVWLVQTTDYANKMDAYKAGIAATQRDWGVYVRPDGVKWTWVAGVYQSEEDANNALQQPGLPTNASSQIYQITGKNFSVAADAMAPCREVLSAVQKVFNLLLNLRSAVSEATDTGSLLLDLTTQYNQIKSGAETLQTLNASLHSQLIATVIYTANQNILGLQEIIFSDSTHPCDLATVNTVLLKTIFSLDNF